MLFFTKYLQMASLALVLLSGSSNLTAQSKIKDSPAKDKDSPAKDKDSPAKDQEKTPEKSPEKNSEKATEKDANQEISERYKALESLAQGLFYLESMYVDPTKVNQDQLVVNAIRGMVAELDPHTVLMPKKDFEDLTMGTHGKFGGVGIIVSQEKDGLVVVSPIEDTPAYKAGIKSGDQIIEIDGKAITKMNIAQAMDTMRGLPGSKLRLKIQRSGNKTPLNFELMREIIKVKSVKTLDLTQNIHYLRISSFQENTYNELSEYLKKVDSKEKIAGLVLDLRDNPGGLLDQAVKVSDLFIESGIIVSTVGRDVKRIEREFASKPGTYSGFPIITLVNGGSASASEIVAGALQDHKRSLIMGETTFGKGSVQTLISLPNGAGLKLTIARYYTPNDRSIQAKGIAPDIYLAPQPEKEKEKENKGERPREIRKEADLKGHIESQDLSDIGKNKDAALVFGKWPENIREDYQIKTAFSYLRGWDSLKPPQ